ncbi:hypothetical protein [Herbaspirillum rubrisubalbicans]|uniref:hypothetical protein n=1 Tax=Herbaspirillum rubrisubalbicans TaxID=80842 RepID=UPI00148E49AB|nr:hypothetical protein [Herbaspirillum rubrisubalbicans]
MTQKASLKIAASAPRGLTPPTGGLFNSRCGIFSAASDGEEGSYTGCHGRSGRCALYQNTANTHQGRRVNKGELLNTLRRPDISKQGGRQYDASSCSDDHVEEEWHGDLVASHLTPWQAFARADVPQTEAYQVQPQKFINLEAASLKML